MDTSRDGNTLFALYERGIKGPYEEIHLSQILTPVWSTPATPTTPSGLAAVATGSGRADPFQANRARIAANLRRRFNESMQLLAGAHAGGKGFQPNGYSIIDENYLSA